MSKKTEIQEYSQTAAALALLGEKYKGVIYDTTTTVGMKGAVEARAEIRGYRVSLEKMRVNIKAPALERCRLIDAEAKTLTAELVALESPIDDQIKAEEARKENEKQARAEAERERVTAIQEAISRIRNVPATMAGKSSDVIRAELARLDGVELTAGSYQEFHFVAMESMKETLAQLGTMLVDAEAHEAEQERIRQEQEAEAARIVEERAELARLRAESETRDAELKKLRDAEDARIRTEQEAEQKRLDAERAEQEKEREAAEKVRHEQAAAQAKIDAERAEVERQKQQQEAEKKALDIRRAKLKKARRDSPEKALADILTICGDAQYSDAEARNDIALIAEASL